MQRTTREEAEEEGLGHGSAPAADEARVRVYSTCKPIGLLAWTQLDSLALLVAISLYGLKVGLAADIVLWRAEELSRNVFQCGATAIVNWHAVDLHAAVSARDACSTFH